MIINIGPEAFAAVVVLLVLAGAVNHVLRDKGSLLAWFTYGVVWACLITLTFLTVAVVVV